MSAVVFRIMLEVVTFGVGFSLVFALAQVCRKKPGLPDYLNFLVFLGNSVIQLFVVLNASNVLAEYPQASFLFLTSIFLLGPANYLYHHVLLNPTQPVPTTFKLQFVPAAMALAGELVFQMLPVAEQRRFLASLLAAPMDHPFTLVLLAGALFISVYSVLPLLLGVAVLNSAAIRPQVRVILVAFCATLVSIALVCGGFLAGSPAAMLAGGMIVTLINVLVFLANIRYPNFYRLVEQEIKKARYERSLLKQLDTDAINERLAWLMGTEALYKDMELTVESLARKLSITPHQLSEFLNERLNTSFRNYINSCRIEAAKKLLATDSDTKLLAVCYEVGFNSKSTFNQCFRKYTGQTPSEFRQAQLAARQGNGD